MRAIITLSALLFATPLFASSPYVDCRVTKVLDQGAFEDTFDFKFSDYPTVSLFENEDDLKELTIGAIELVEEKDGQEIETEESDEGEFKFVFAEPIGSEHIFGMGFKDNGHGLLVFAEGDAPPTDIAELNCKTE